jgi:hypothetical protein
MVPMHVIAPGRRAINVTQPEATVTGLCGRYGFNTSTTVKSLGRRKHLSLLFSP